MQDASSKQQTEQKFKPNHQQIGVPPHSAVPIRGKTNKQKLSTNLTKFTQTTGPISGGQKPKGKKEFNLLQGTNRNTGVQITEEEIICKLPEKEFRITIVKMIKTLKTKWIKC